MNAAAINQVANHLNVAASAVIKLEEWANVLFAVVKGIGARFVSKKVVKAMNLETINEKLAQYAQGRVSVKYDAAFNGGTYYTYDDYSGAGCTVNGSLRDALARVEALTPHMQGYASYVESALSA